MELECNILVKKKNKNSIINKNIRLNIYLFIKIFKII